MRAWRYASASVQGTSHVESAQPCQDACRVEKVLTPENEEFLVLTASDGAGSARFSMEGSQIVCRFLTEKLCKLIAGGWTPDQITHRRTQVFLRYVSLELDRTARERGLTKREFAATLLMAIVGDRYSVFAQLGDGAIVINCTDGYQPVFWPQSGEYANMTYFVTDKTAVNQLQFKTIEQTIDEIALFTDGIQSLALQYESRNAHQPFFKPLFNSLRQASMEALPEMNNHLAAFLSSARVNERTDDDKTLVLACRQNNLVASRPDDGNSEEQHAQDSSNL